MMSSGRRRIERMTPDTRERLVQIARANPDLTYADLGRRFGINSSRVSEIVREEGHLRQIGANDGDGA